MLKQDGWDEKQVEDFTSTDQHQKWNQKFALRDKTLLSPEAFFVRNLARFKRSRLLDLASGDGRNSMFFAEKGFSVTAVDFSEVALARLQDFALEKHLSVNAVQFDLTEEPALEGLFDSVLMSHYKPNRALIEKIPQWLTPGGIFAICTFNMLEHSRNNFNKEYCLSPLELIHIDGLDTILYDSFEERANETADIRYLDGYIFLKKD